MEESLLGKIFSKIIVAIFIIAVLDLMFVNWWILKSEGKQAPIENTVSNSQVEVASPTPIVIPSFAPTVQQEKSVETKTVVEVQEKTVVQTPNKEIFVPMGSGNTKSGSFEDLYGVEVTIDTGKYSAIDYIVFEGSLWVEGGNGRAWAQLKNVSDNNPFIESQISNPTSTPTLKTSAKIPYASGSKTYRVMAKTEQTDYAAHVDNARLKIVLK